ANLTKETQNASVQVKCPAEPGVLRETGALGHPRRAGEWKDGWLTIPSAEYTSMQTRIFTAPRADISRSSLEWFASLSEIWRAIEKVPPMSETVEIPSDIISLADDWRVSTELPSEKWNQSVFDDRAWRKVRLGTFAAVGLPTKTIAGFRRTIQVPESWKGKQVLLNFEGSYWFYGIVPEGRLWINGELAALKQPLRAFAESSYLVDVTEAAKTGRIVFALEIDGTKFQEGKPQGRPAGVTGLFWLSTMEPVVAESVLPGPWFAAKDVNVLTPVADGAKTEYVYLQTEFTTGPRKAKRLFLESDVKLRYVMLNGLMVNVPMNSLDVTGLVNFNGKNALTMSDDARTLARRQRLGFVYQFHHLLPELNAVDNVAAPLMINGMSRGKARKRGQELLRQMGLVERDHHRPGQLSGGEQQRVAIARSLANRPKVLIADEPTGNLDPNTSRLVFQNLFDIAKQEGVAVLVATHNVELTSVMDRVLTLHEGRLEPAPARAGQV
ncbi:MAG: ATP-binding cassette domain-containing protein, partial [Hyphomonadaceae bacterium]